MHRGVAMSPGVYATAGKDGGKALFCPVQHCNNRSHN